MNRFNSIVYKTSPKGESPEWKILKCVECNFQFKMVYENEMTTFSTNETIHASHALIKIELSQSNVEDKPKSGIEKFVKEMILPFIKNGVKNCKITSYLKDTLLLDPSKIPTGEQLTRYRCSYKSKRINEITVKDKAGYIKWVEENSLKIEKPNDLFVVNYILAQDNFVFILSSMNMMLNAKGNQYELGFVSIDSTYKLITCKFPLLIISTRDKKRHSRIIAFAIISNEDAKTFGFVINSLQDFMKDKLNFEWKIKVYILFYFYFYFFIYYLI